MSGKCPNCWGPLGATGYYQPPPRSPRAQALQRKIDEQAALLDALLPVALAAVALEHDYPGLWLGPVREAVRSLSPATRETLARLAKAQAKEKERRP